MCSLKPEEILQSLPSTYYVINIETKEIVSTNDPEFNGDNASCYRFLFNSDLPCENENGQCVCQRKEQYKGEARFQLEKFINGEKEFFDAKVSFPKENIAVASYTNITQETRSEKELKINRQRLERAQGLAFFGYWEFNLNEKIMISSEGSRDIYGVPDERMPLEEAQKLPLPQYRQMLNEALNALIHEGKPYNVKFEIKRPDNGETRWIHSIAEYRRDKKMVFGVIHDITETHYARKALEESENNLKLLFQNMNSAFAFHKIITDEKGTPIDYVFLDVNSKFEELTGLKRKDIVNKRALEVLPETGKFWVQRYGNVALTGEPQDFAEYAEEFGKYFQISAYSPQKEYFAVTFFDITDRIKSEQKLKDTLIDLNLAQQISKTGNWRYDPEEKKIQWSKQLYDIFGRNPQLPPPYSEELKKYTDETTFLRYEAAIKEAIEKGTPFELEMKVLLGNENVKWVKVICQPDDKRGSNGHFLRGTIQDITGSKKIEDDLNNSNELLRTIIENIPDAIYMKDRNFRKLIANEGDARNCSVKSVKELIGKTDHDVFPKEIADSYLVDDKKVIERGEPIINRHEVLPQNELGQRWLLTTKIPLRNDENEIVGLVGIGRDITELKQKELRLQLLQQTIEQSPMSIIITDPKNAVEYVNPAFTKITGYTLEEALGKHPSELLESGENGNDYLSEIHEAIESGRSWRGELRSKKKDGTIYWEDVIISPIFDESHKIKHSVALTEDITDKKQMVEELKVAKEKAEESDRLKSLFLANMSHEIRTPLNGILGFSNIICSGEAEKDKMEMYGKIIENSGRRLLTVIDDIIDISKIQANQLKIYLGKFNFNELIQELFVFYRTQNAEQLNNIEFECNLCEDENYRWIYSDKNRIYQVLRNLIDNAFKFTQTGKIEFGFFASSEEALTLFVKDTGIGIEPDKEKVIFQSFRQAQEGTSRKYDGSGLGLAIVSGILNRLGGEIWVDSTPGSGSTFYITLPHEKETTEPAPAAKHQNTVREVKPEASKRIVSVEDDKASVEYLKIVMKSLGYELVNFSLASEAISYLKEQNANLVLMDVQLPEMNGFDATREIKAAFPEMPVIIQTAYAMKTDMEKAYQAGCDDYLAKPLSLRILKEKIKKYVEN